MLQENGALCDKVAEIQENIITVKEERKFLLKKLLEYESNETPISDNKKAIKRINLDFALESKSLGKKIKPQQLVVRKQSSQHSTSYPYTVDNSYVYNMGEIIPDPGYYSVGRDDEPQ